VTLIDTSAWIEFFRPMGDPQIKSLVRDLITVKQAAFTCPVAFELLTGARKEELNDLNAAFGLATRIALRPEHWDQAASSNAALRANGFTVPATDLLIATLAHSEKLPLLAKDSHFELLRKHALPKLSLVSPT
jgi:predicted nucleic acid-binding protein